MIDLSKTPAPAPAPAPDTALAEVADAIRDLLPANSSVRYVRSAHSGDRVTVYFSCDDAIERTEKIAERLRLGRDRVEVTGWGRGSLTGRVETRHATVDGDCFGLRVHVTGTQERTPAVVEHAVLPIVPIRDDGETTAELPAPTAPAVAR